VPRCVPSATGIGGSAQAETRAVRASRLSSVRAAKGPAAFPAANAVAVVLSTLLSVFSVSSVAKAVAVVVSLLPPLLLSFVPFVVKGVGVAVCASAQCLPGFITLPPVAAFRMATHDFRIVSLG